MTRSTIRKRAPKRAVAPAVTVAKGDLAIVAPDGFSAIVHTTRWVTRKAGADYPPAVALSNGSSVSTAPGKGQPMPPGIIPGLQTQTMREFFLPPGIVPGAHGVLIMRCAEDGTWSAKLGKTLKPAVLEKDADMPVGSSALPPTLERVVPPGFEYWKVADPVQARKIRDALVEKNFFDESLLKIVDGEIRLCAQKLYLYEPDLAQARKSRDEVIKSIAMRSGADTMVSVGADVGGFQLESVLARTNTIAMLSPGSTFEETVDQLVLTQKSATGGSWLIVTEDTPGARAELERVAPVFKIDAVDADDFIFAASFDPGPDAIWVGPTVSPRSDVMDAVLNTFDRAYAASAAITAKGGAEDSKGELGGEVEDKVQRVTNYQGIPVWIDRPAGFTQTGVGPDGTPWSRTYTTDYGFIPGAAGGDDEDLDVFVGPDPKAPYAFWIEQHYKDGSFDEFKVFLGYPDEESARKVYAAHVPPDLAGECCAVPISAMRSMLGIPPRDLIATAKRMAERNDLVIQLAKSASMTATNSAGTEQRFVLGVVLEPDVVDSQNDTYSAEEVEKTAHEWMEKYLKTGLMHQGDVSEKVRPVESYIAQVDQEIGGQPVKKGSWLLGVHILDNDLWTAVKAGDLTGFSIGGSAIRKPDPAATAKHKANSAR